MEENKTVAVEETPVAAEAPKAEAAETPAAEQTGHTILNASVDPDKFDWDAFESEEVPGEDRAKVAEEYDKTLSKVVENEVVEGVVTAITKREVIVNIGYKSEGVIMAPEFRYNPDLKVGDKVVYCRDKYEAVVDADALLLVTEWKEFRMPSWEVIRRSMKPSPVLFDGRNVFDPTELDGIQYVRIG